jgi:hypothetical protein
LIRTAGGSDQVSPNQNTWSFCSTCSGRISYVSVVQSGDLISRHATGLGLVSRDTERRRLSCRSQVRLRSGGPSGWLVIDLLVVDSVACGRMLASYHHDQMDPSGPAGERKRVLVSAHWSILCQAEDHVSHLVDDVPAARN